MVVKLSFINFTQMIKFISLILFAFLLKVSGLAQVFYPSDANLQQLIEKKISYNKQTNGLYDGYRIKIHFGTDKMIARDVRGRFLTAFPDVSAYEEYEQPNFVVVVGDFKTKVEAFGLYKKIEGLFPGSFIIKDKIRPVSLKALTTNGS